MIKLIRIAEVPNKKNPEGGSKSKHSEDEFVLLCGKEVTVGRKQQDISLQKDVSISRNHATIQVDHPIANVTNAALTPSLVITDLGSKFGTFINDGIEAARPVSMREPTTLSHGDRFRFGLGANIFRIQYTPLVATSSCLKSSSELKRNICALGGHLVPEWTDKCDFLVMESLTLTVKVVCAILSAKYIVTPAYFQDYLGAVSVKKSTVPNPADYQPELAESSLSRGVSFRPDPRRTKLFENKLFLFATNKQAKKISVAIKCAGGNVDLISNVSHVVFKSPDTIMVTPSDESVINNQIKSGIETYKSAKKRLIQESEIGLAAVYIRTDKHCNVFSNIDARTIFPNISSQTQEPTNSVTIVQDSDLASQPTQRSCPTQSQNNTSRVEESVVESNPNERNKSTRGNVDSEDISTISKRPRARDVDAEDDQEDVASRSKRRLEVNKPAFETGPSPKKVRQVAGAPTSPASSGRFTRSSAKALGSIFNMSSDESDDDITKSDETTRPPTQNSRSSQRSSNDKPVNEDDDGSGLTLLTPMDTTPDPNDSLPVVSDSELVSQNASRTTRSQSKSKSRMDETIVETPSVGKSPTKGNDGNETVDGIRNEGIDKDVGEPSTSTTFKRPRDVADSRNKRRGPSKEELGGEPSNKKLCQEASASSSTSMESRFTKLNIKKKDDNDDPESLKPAPVVFKSLLLKKQLKPQWEKTITKEGTKMVTNFKVFKKVIPLTPINKNIPPCSNGSNITTSTKRTTSTVITFRRYAPFSISGQADIQEINEPAEQPEPDRISRTDRELEVRVRPARSAPPIPIAVDSDEEDAPDFTFD